MSAGGHLLMPGVVLASASLAGAVWGRLWSLRRQEARVPVPAPQAAEEAPVILVHVTGAPSTARALAMASLLAQERGAEIVLVSVIVVPLSLPLDASIEEMETESAQALAAARDAVVQHGVPARLLVRHGRSMASGLLAAVQEAHPALMAIGVGPSQEDLQWGEMVEKVAQRAGCEVVVDRLPDSAPAGQT